MNYVEFWMLTVCVRNSAGDIERLLVIPSDNRGVMFTESSTTRTEWTCVTDAAELFHRPKVKFEH